MVLAELAVPSTSSQLQLGVVVTSFNPQDYILQKHIESFSPTYLYLKRHSISGLLYFGKKILKGEENEIENYTGSGRYWLDHLKKHGKENIETVWYCLFTDVDSLVKTALALSDIMNIVNFKIDNKKVFANLIIETGLTGGAPGKTYTDEERAIMSENHWAKKIQRKEDNPNFGSKRDPSVGRKISQKAMGNKRGLGKKRTEEQKQHQREIKTGKVSGSKDIQEKKIKFYKEVIEFYNTNPPIDGTITETGSKSKTYTSYLAAFCATYCDKWSTSSVNLKNIILRKYILTKHL